MSTEEQLMELEALAREASIAILAALLSMNDVVEPTDIATATSIYDNIFALGHACGKVAAKLE
jgi:hypothetical protein